ncbi:MAG: asparagine synthetase B [archaeon]|nr:asparagine synthetase B [archaeon]
MCSIIGIYSRSNGDVSVYLSALMDSLKHRGPEAFGIKTPKEEFKSKSFKQLKFPKSPIALGHCLLSTTGYGIQPLSKGNVSISHNGQIYNYKKLVKEQTMVSDSESIAYFFANELKKSSFENALKKFMKKAEGEYAVGLFYKNSLYAFRDPIGLKPLWFGSNDSVFAFASEPSALMKIDIQFPQPLLPGHMLKISKKGFETKPIFNIENFKKTIPKKHSIKNLKSAFDETIQLQTKNLEKAAVLFSGGVDSSLIAKAVSQKVPNTKLFVCGTKNSQDMVSAKEVAEELNLELVSVEISEEKIKELMFRSMKILSFFDEMQIGIAVTELACADAIVKHGYKVVFSGQGSDEIFCGYNNYAKILKGQNYSAVEKEIWFSLSRIWSRNFYRDDAIIASNSLELRVPLVSMQFLKQAMAIPAKEKIKNKEDKIRKWPIRELAKLYNISDSVALKPKKALQYGSGSQKIVSKILKGN